MAQRRYRVLNADEMIDLTAELVKSDINKRDSDGKTP